MKEKLLIVDDAELNRAVLEELLSSEYETICACGGREAMEIMERERDNLALVLLDVMMPDIDGYEVLEYMNFNGLLKHTPVIMIRPRTRRNACGWARWILCANRMLRMLSNAGSKISSNCTITRMGLKKCSSKKGKRFPM